MLNSVLNSSKNEKPLKDWVEEEKIDRLTQIIPADNDLDISHFKDFIEKRKLSLTEKIKKLV